MNSLTEYSQQRGYALAKLEIKLHELREQFGSSSVENKRQLFDDITHCMDEVKNATKRLDDIELRLPWCLRHRSIRTLVRIGKWIIPMTTVAVVIASGIDTGLDRIEYESCVLSHRKYEKIYLQGLNNTVPFPPLDQECSPSSNAKIVILNTVIVATVVNIVISWGVSQYENVVSAFQNQLTQLRLVRNADEKFRLYLAALSEFHRHPTKEQLQQCANNIPDDPDTPVYSELGSREEILSGLLPLVPDNDIRAELEALRVQVATHIEQQGSRRRSRSQLRAQKRNSSGSHGRRRKIRHGERGDGGSMHVNQPLSLSRLKRACGLEELTHIKIGDWWIGETGVIAETEDEVINSSEGSHRFLERAPRPIISVGGDDSV